MSVTAWVHKEEDGTFIVFWEGYQHGGHHFTELDAELHADRLRNAEEWDRQSWIERQRERERQEWIKQKKEVPK